MDEIAEAITRGMARRMAARSRYRRRRDRKIAVDYLGKHFEYQHTNELAGTKEWLRVQLVGYDVARHTVRMVCWFENKGAHTTTSSITWATDTFWSLYRNGGLRDAA